jgi:hypothetical protein
MIESRSTHERSLGDEVAELVATDLCILAGDRRIADLRVLARRPNSVDGHATTQSLIETITESILRLRAFRSVVVDMILGYDKNQNLPADATVEEINPIFHANNVSGERARAIDAELCTLVKQHGATIKLDGTEERLNRYKEIEALQSALRQLGVDRRAMLPYIKGPSAVGS